VTLAIAASAAVLTTAAACNSATANGETPAKPPAPRVTAEMLAKGKTTYMTVCAPCHGEHGKGDGPASLIFKPPPRDHTDAAYMNAISDEELGRIITMGGAIKGKPNMPSNPQLHGDDLAAVIAYVRTLSRPQ